MRVFLPIRLLVLLGFALVARPAFAAAPMISNFMPQAGAPGTQVTINGVNFINGTTTVFFGNTQADITSLLANKIVATVRVGTETGLITVFTSGGFGQSASDFTVAPRIDSFDPASAPVGNQVAINGANFIPNVGATTVKFGGVTAGTVNVTATTLLFANVPNGAITGPITVATFAGTNNSATNFIVAGTGPVISDFSPASGPPGQEVIINGGDFTGATSVTFNLVNGTNVVVTAATQVHAFVPTNATTGLIRVTTPAGTAVSSSNFVVTGNAPIVTGFLPASGKAGDPVTISGVNFTTTTNVTFNGTNVTSFTATADTQINTTVPPGATTGRIRVMNPIGTGVSGSNFLVGPKITSFSPASGPFNQTVNIFGDGFFNVTGVRFGSSNAMSFSQPGQTQLAATVPTGASTGPITVTTQTGTNTTSSNFVVTGVAPVITGLSRTNGLVGDGVTIDGLNFTTVTNVAFNGTRDPTFFVASDTQISATVPTNATTGSITVTSPDGAAATGLFYLPPRLGGFAPASGVAGAIVILTGTNFTGATAIQFTSTNATTANAVFTNDSPNQISAIVPTYAKTGPLSVVSPGGIITSTNNFVVLPKIDSFSPTFGPVGTVVTNTGTSFFDVSNVTFNGVSANFTNASSTKVTAVVPAGATTGPISIKTPDGTATTTNKFYLPPSITSSSPGSGLGGTPVMIQGANLSDATNVTFNNLATATFTNKSLTRIDALVPHGATTGPIRVFTPGGSATSMFFFLVPPVITSFTPTSGVPGTSVSILGTNFAGDAAVKFNGTNAVITLLLFTQINATVPTNATTGPISVSTSGGTATNAMIFTVLSNSVSLTITPTNGLLALSWPASAPGFRLEFATNLAPPLLWFSSTNATSVVSGQFTVTNEAGNGQQFFRLTKP